VIPQITIILVAIFALMQMVITMLTGFARIENEVHFYDEGDIDLRRRVRAHGNFTETVPMSLMAIAGAELMGSPESVVWGLGSALLIGRLWHYYVIRTVGWGNGRAAGMMLTFVAMSGGAVAILWQVLS